MSACGICLSMPRLNFPGGRECQRAAWLSQPTFEKPCPNDASAKGTAAILPHLQPASFSEQDSTRFAVSNGFAFWLAHCLTCQPHSNQYAMRGCPCSFAAGSFDIGSRMLCQRPKDQPTPSCAGARGILQALVHLRHAANTEAWLAASMPASAKLRSLQLDIVACRNVL